MNEVPAHLAITSYRKKKPSHQPLNYVLPREPISIDEQLHVFYHGKMVRNAKSHYSKARLSKWSNEKSTPQRLVELEKAGAQPECLSSIVMGVTISMFTALVCEWVKNRFLKG